MILWYHFPHLTHVFETAVRQTALAGVGLDIEIKDLNKDFLVMGKNDSGKSNVCYALRKVLDYNIRKYPLTENDSSNFNREKITIEITFSLDSITPKNKNCLGSHIEKDENENDVLNVYFEATFNKELMVYEEKLFFGKVEREEKSASAPNFLDTALEIIYINPNYDIDGDKKYYFRTKREYALSNDENIREEIKSAIVSLNEEIKKDDGISGVLKDIGSYNDVAIFEETGFEIGSNIEVGNIFKSLDIYPVDKKTNQKIGIGDGKNKTLSLILQKMSHINDKQKIFIVEEPENHLFPLLQKNYLSMISQFGADQLIFTTHSPFIVDFKKIHQLIKLFVSYDDGKRTTCSKSINIEENDYAKYGYLMNSELAEMFFCDCVLLVEGFSEKYFYNLLYIQDGEFRKYMNKRKMGVFCVNGIAFADTKSLLEKLGIVVYIKTDNDVFNKKGYYAGLSRCFNCLSDEDKGEIISLLNPNGLPITNTNELFKISNSTVIEANMGKLVDICYRNGVFLSPHHDGFEKDFLEFVKEENIDTTIEILREAKLKNLHDYVVENNKSLSINEENKENILVRFVNNEPF